jgi:hypothetical protein
LKKNKYYVYVYLDTRKTGIFRYGKYKFRYKPFYVGKGTGYRYKTHLHREKHYNPYFSNKIKAIYKETNKEPLVIIYKNNLLEKEAFKLENNLIKTIGKENLVNLSEGGEGQSGFHHTKKSKLKIKQHNSKYWLGKPKSKAVRLKISQTKRRLFKEGKLISPMLGKKHSIKTINKIIKAHKGKKLSKEHIKKLIKYHNENPPKNIKRWKIMSPKNKKYIVFGLYKFCKKHKLHQHCLHRVSTGDLKQYKGWKCFSI